jgi:hypothetical protein
MKIGSDQRLDGVLLEKKVPLEYALQRCNL